MRIDLDVPFIEKDEAKAFGAKWDPTVKKWYVPDGTDPAAFRKWMPQQNRTPYIYLVVAEKECWKCHKKTKVAGFGIPYRAESIDVPSVVENQLSTENDKLVIAEIGHIPIDTTIADSLAIVPSLGCVPMELRTYLYNSCGLKPVKSKSTRQFSLACTCTNCGCLQGNYHLFDESSSPFFITSESKLSQLTFVRVEVSGVYGSLESWDETDDLKFEWAQNHHESFSQKLCENIFL